MCIFPVSTPTLLKSKLFFRLQSDSEIWCIMWKRNRMRSVRGASEQETYGRQTNRTCWRQFAVPP